MVYILQTALQLGLIYGFVSLALFLSYRVLNISDLATDGTFVFSMAVSVRICATGHPVLGLLCGILAGCLSGLVTGCLQTLLRIPSILAGIITNTGLYTINLMVMGWSSNLTLLKQDTVFTLLRNAGLSSSAAGVGLPLVLMLAAALLMNWFLSTRIGLSIRATGNNPAMVTASSINPNKMIRIGLMVSNACTGLAGGLAGQLQKSADINAGSSIVVTGLACLVIGESVLHGTRSISRNILSAIVGSILYRMLYAIILKTRILPIECLKLLTAIIVTLAIARPILKKKHDRKETLKHAGN